MEVICSEYKSALFFLHAAGMEGTPKQKQFNQKGII